MAVTKGIVDRTNVPHRLRLIEPRGDSLVLRGTHIDEEVWNAGQRKRVVQRAYGRGRKVEALDSLPILQVCFATWHRERLKRASIDGKANDEVPVSQFFGEPSAERSGAQVLSHMAIVSPSTSCARALDPRTGNVLAMVGGRGYQESQLNRATDALRQPGSVFKPIVYAAALETGLSPISMFTDAPEEFTYDGNAKYRPANYGGGYSMRDVTLRTALVKSLNVVTVDIAMRTGLKRVARYAEDFGLPRSQPYPSLALGTTEATPLALASAYTAFANAGVRVEPNVITRMTDSSGQNIVDETSRTRAVVEPATAYMITDMLSDVIDHGTARAARGSVKQTAIAGKTGTSHDGWFVGYTPNLVVAVWIGFDNNRQLGLTGARAALLRMD